MNTNISYFVGALHSDGTFHLYKDKRRKRDVYRIRFQIGEKSLPMLRYLQQIFAVEFGRTLKINFDGTNKYGTRVYTLGTSVNALLPKLSALGISKGHTPQAIKINKKLFCAYLAGLIDGDGNVCIKRPTYPQCEVRIISGKPDWELKRLIIKHLGCSVRLEKFFVNSIIEARQVSGKGCRHCFYLSSKNLSTFSELVYPYIQIRHKRKLLQKFFKIKAMPRQWNKRR